MIRASIPIFLASKSPRRRKLLKQLNLKFKSFSVDMDEKIHQDEKPYKAVIRLSKEKLALAKSEIKNGVIITADTIVVLDKTILGKPLNKKDAFRILKLLSGKTHIVYTGYSIFNSRNDKTISEYEKTDVTFRELTDEEITDYIKESVIINRKSEGTP
jgi:septum formation protein